MRHDLAEQKRALRQALRLRRQMFVRARDGAPWWPAEHEMADLVRADIIVATYNGIGSEADPSPLNAFATAAGATLAWPRIDADHIMRFYALGPSGQMTADHARIPAPAADAVAVAPDVILMPLLGFDRRGTRLGQGAGYYDRTIAALDALSNPGSRRARRIGVAWSVQEVDMLPCDDWDMPLDAIVTERQWIVP